MVHPQGDHLLGLGRGLNFINLDNQQQTLYSLTVAREKIPPWAEWRSGEAFLAFDPAV
jgi:hypothetical protein